MRKRILLVFVVVSLLTVCGFAVDNPFPEKPIVSPQDGDNLLVTEEDGITIGMLKNAIYIKELYPQIWTFVNELLFTYEADLEVIFIQNDEIVKLAKENKVLKVFAVSSATVVLVLIIKGIFD